MVVSSVPTNRSNSHRGIGNRRGVLPVTSRQRPEPANGTGAAGGSPHHPVGRRPTAAMIRASCRAIAVLFPAKASLRAEIVAKFGTHVFCSAPWDRAARHDWRC
jgi:hypothetical protein